MVVLRDKLYISKDGVNFIALFGENITRYYALDYSKYEKGSTGLSGAILGGILLGTFGAILGGVSSHEEAKYKFDVFVEFADQSESIIRIDSSLLELFSRRKHNNS